MSRRAPVKHPPLLAPLLTLVACALAAPAGAAPEVRPYPTRDFKADRRARQTVNGQAVAVRTFTTRDAPERVAVWYLSALNEAGWTQVGGSEAPELERVDGDTLRIRATAPIKDRATLDEWFALADGGRASLPLVVVEVTRRPGAKATTVRQFQPAAIEPQRGELEAPPQLPPGMIGCAACELESVINQPGAVVAVFTGPGGAATGVERIRAGAARSGWTESTSDRGLPNKGAHTLGFQRDHRACLATVTQGPSSWRFRAGVVCETP